MRKYFAINPQDTSDTRENENNGGMVTAVENCPICQKNQVIFVQFIHLDKEFWKIKPWFSSIVDLRKPRELISYDDETRRLIHQMNQFLI